MKHLNYYHYEIILDLKDQRNQMCVNNMCAILKTNANANEHGDFDDRSVIHILLQVR